MGWRAYTRSADATHALSAIVTVVVASVASFVVGWWVGELLARLILWWEGR